MLTRKQLDLLNFINKRLTRDGVPPSFDEMKESSFQYGTMYQLPKEAIWTAVTKTIARITFENKNIIFYFKWKACFLTKKKLFEIRTHYEKLFSSKGSVIKYCCFSL